VKVDGGARLVGLGDCARNLKSGGYIDQGERVGASGWVCSLHYFREWKVSSLQISPSNMHLSCYTTSLRNTWTSKMLPITTRMDSMFLLHLEHLQHDDAYRSNREHLFASLHGYIFTVRLFTSGCAASVVTHFFFLQTI
jgi:hypothetical protein